VALALVRRMQAMERRLALMGATAAPDGASAEVGAARQALRANRPVPRSPFTWLRPASRQAVFVPVLLGAGVLLSAVAFVVQRAAELTARTALEPAIARDLALLAPPAGGLRPGGGPAPGPAPAPPGRGWRRRALAVLLLAAAIGMGWLVVDRLGDATQTRPESATAGRSVIVVYVEQRDTESPAAAVRALWVACRDRLPDHATLAGVSAIDQDRAVLVIEPRLTDHGWRRLDGCFEDMTLERVTARADRVRDPALGAGMSGP
jgi:hypothetical protein